MPRKKKRRETFQQTQARWYRKLAESGFHDIESTDPRTGEQRLKRHDAFHVGRRRTPGRPVFDWENVLEIQSYYRLATLFLAEFPMSGLGILTRRLEMKIIQHHSEGASLRKIAGELDIHHLQAHLVIRELVRRLVYK